METGKNNTSTASRSGLFSGREQEDIQSIGLCFEPDFFSVWFYADKFGEDCIGRERFAFGEIEKIATAEFADKAVLFALSHSPIYTLIPTALFEEAQAKTYLAFNTEFSGKGAAESDDIPEAGITLVYNDPKESQEIIDKHWPGLKVHHAAGQLIRILLRLAKTSERRCYIYAEGDTYFFFAFENGKLLMSNAVEASHTEDALYFTLFALRQLYTEAGEKTPVTLLGAAAERPDLITGLGAYVNDLHTDLEPRDIPVSGQPDAAEFARHIIGYSAQLCV